MSEIEIYTKIMEIIKDEKPEEASTALEFATRKNQNELYKVQQSNMLGCNQGLVGAAYTQEYAAKAHAEAEQRAAEIVRKVVREELENKNAAVTVVGS